ncbi:MAG: hypothetical protein AB8B50_04180 [Pirellulaceae bacterium]
MTAQNPYEPQASDMSADIGKVKIRPIELLKRSYEMVKDDYWLFLGITVVGVLLGSMVPLYILLGPLMVGIFICYKKLENQEKVEFADLFKGFEQFADALIATLILVAITFLVIIPFAILFVVALIASEAQSPNDFPITAFLVFYPLLLLLSFAVSLPFIFTFQLIADRKMTAMNAVKASFRGVIRNLGGVILFFIVLGFVSMLLALMCYFPAFLFMPISFGALFLLYRDIFGLPGQETDMLVADIIPE